MSFWQTIVMDALHHLGDFNPAFLGDPDSLLLLLHNGVSEGNLWSCSQYSANNAWNVNNNGNNRRQRVGVTPKHTVGKRVDVCSSASRY